MKFVHYCECGAEWELREHPDRSARSLGFDISCDCGRVLVSWNCDRRYFIRKIRGPETQKPRAAGSGQA